MRRVVASVEGVASLVKAYGFPNTFRASVSRQVLMMSSVQSRPGFVPCRLRSPDLCRAAVQAAIERAAFEESGVGSRRHDPAFLHHGYAVCHFDGGGAMGDDDGGPVLSQGA